MREKTAERKDPILTDAEPKFLVRQEKPAVRCEICHQVDLFNPETGNCARCARIISESPTEYPQTVQTETVLPQPPRLSSRWSGAILALGAVVLIYGIAQTFNLIWESVPPHWVERVARNLLDPKSLVMVGMAVVLAMTGRKSQCRRRRQKLAKRENG